MTNFESKILICKDCSSEFVFSANEQDFFASKGFHAPTRCKQCRLIRKNDSENQHDLRSVNQMYDITCSKCGKKDKIPFRPRSHRLLFCKACYQPMKNKSSLKEEKVA